MRSSEDTFKKIVDAIQRIPEDKTLDDTETKNLKRRDSVRFNNTYVVIRGLPRRSAPEDW